MLGRKVALFFGAYSCYVPAHEIAGEQMSASHVGTDKWFDSNCDLKSVSGSIRRRECGRRRNLDCRVEQRFLDSVAKGRSRQSAHS